ncbi:MAG: Gfo/Idh/MocA family oxidoreductase [Bacteroidota bacterium]
MKINVALASFGMSGKVFHGPLLHVHEGFNLTHVLERHRSDSSENYKYATIVRKYEDLVANKDIDLIIVNTPDHLHYEMTKNALDAGKHVVVEKPFVLNATQGNELIDLAEKKNLVLSVFQNRRWDGDFMTVKRVIDEQLVGRLVEFESHFDRFRNYIQKDTWKENPDLGTGTLYNLGSHMIDQALVLFGMPEGVFAEIKAQRTGSKVDDSFDIKMLYNNNLKVTVKGSYLVRESGPRYILHGTSGSFLKYGIDPQEQCLKDGYLPDIPGWGEEEEDDWGFLNTNLSGFHFMGKIETIPGNYLAFYDDIHEAITSGKKPDVNPSESLNGIHIIEAALESSSKRKVVTRHI